MSWAEADGVRVYYEVHSSGPGLLLVHGSGGLRHPELTALVQADRAEAEKLPVLDRLLTPAFREGRPTWRSCSGRWARSTPPRCRTCGT